MKRPLSLRVLTLLLALVLVVGYVPASVLATEADDALATSEPTVPETTVPETIAPETTEPEATEPETTVPETTVPETTVPKNTDLKANRSLGFVSETHDTFSVQKSNIAPGVTQSINYAYAKDGKQMVYYVVTADINRDDVAVYANYKDNQYTTFGMQKLRDQMAAAQTRNTTDNTAPYYNEYYTVVAGVNGDFYNMSTGKPSGAFVMEGTVVNASNNRPFFAIMEDGTPVIGAGTNDWNTYVETYGNVQEAVGGSVVLVKNGADVTANASGSYNTDRHSRSCVGVTAEGKVVIMSLDGRQEPFSCGGTMHELAQIMLEAGCVAAINLDGGGSTTFAARQEGEDEITVVNRPSDGSERTISSSLLVVSTTPPSNVFGRAVLTAEQTYVTPGSVVNVTASGVSPAGTAAEIPENALWQLADSSMGTIENGKFISNDSTGDAVVQLTVDGEVVGETTIHVVIPDTLSFTQSAVAVPYGKTVELSLSATYGLNKVYINPNDLVFTLSDASLGTIDGLTFTAAAETELATGTLTAELACSDTLSAKLTINLGKASVVVIDFEDGKVYFEAAKSGTSGGFTGEKASVYSVTAENGQVFRGERAVAIDLDYGQNYGPSGSGWTGGYFPNRSIPCEAGLKTFGFWLYLPELEDFDAMKMKIFVKGDTTGNKVSPEPLYVGDASEMECNGWRYYSADVSSLGDNESLTLFLYFLDEAAGDRISSDRILYIDDITLDYSSAVDDREAPVFEYVRAAYGGLSDAVALDGQTIDSNVVSVTAKANDDMTKDNYTGLDMSSAKAYVDGVQVTSGFSCTDAGVLTIEDVTLADGTHTFKFEICDKMGNLSWIERQITIAADSGMETITIVPADPAADRLPIGSLYWVDINATDIENVNQVTTTLNLDNNSQWELAHMEVAYGFEATYSIDSITNNAVITIERTGENDQTGAATLASIPIRTWEWKLTEKTPAEAWAGRGIWPKAIHLEAYKGVVSFADGSTGTFSMPVLDVDTEIYGHYPTVNGGGDYATKTSWHIHTKGEPQDKAATCTEPGYTDRVFCVGCSCGTVCDHTATGCGAVVEWGTTVPATGHNYSVVEGVLKCTCGKLFNGVWEDGKTYVDGVVQADGWVGDSYYVNGQKLTGIQKIEGFYYDFGEDGVCAGKTKYTGLLTEGEKSYYAMFGELATGWRMLTDGWYYFDKTTGAGLVGDHTIDVNGVNVPYTFEATGKLASDVWYTNTKNQMYRYYGPGYYTRVWKEIDGKTYFLNWVGVAARGVYGVQDSPHMPEIFYLFDLDTCELIDVVDGFMTYGGNTYYYHTRGANAPAYGFRCIDGRYYYFSTSTGAMRTGDYTVMSYNSNGLLAENRTFHFDETYGYAVDKDGNPLTSLETQVPDAGYPKFVEKSGNTYYYRSADALAFGFWKIGDYYYYFSTSSGAMRTGDYTVQAYTSNGLLTEPRTFHFDETHGYAVDKDGNPLTTLELQEPVEAYPKFVEKDGKTYYYRSANAIAFGFWEIDGHYYYFSTSSGAMRTGDYTVVSYTSNGLLTTNRTFHFDETHGYAVDENGNPLTTLETQKPEPAYPKFVEKDGKTYYYRNANALAFGFWEIDGHYYYFSTSSGEMRTGDYKVMSYASNGLLDKHTTFHFDEVHGYAVDANGDPITSLS